MMHVQCKPLAPSATCCTWPALKALAFCSSNRWRRRVLLKQPASQASIEHFWRRKAAADAAFDGGSYYSDAAAAAPAKGAGMPATVFNLVNVIMGAGYVSIPFACKQGGWAVLVVLCLLGCVFCYTGQALLQCCKLVDERNAASAASSDRSGSLKILQQQQQQLVPAGYEAVAGQAFGKFGAALVSGIMYAELLGICCVYVVLEAETLSNLLSSTAFGQALTHALGTSAYGLLAASLMIPTVLLPDLESLSVLGALGVAAAAAVGLTLAGLFVISLPSGWSSLADTTLVKVKTLPQVLGILAFVYAGHSTFPVIQRSMAAPAKGPRAITYGYVATATICTILGGFGYALYGSSTMPVITASLPALSVVALVCTALTLCNPFSAFALTLEPVAVAVQQQLGQGSSSISDQEGNKASTAARDVPYSLRAAIRLGLAMACSVAALVLPYVAEVMAFVGALLTMSISLIIPALMHAVLLGKELPGWWLLLDCIVLLVGIACAYIGATSALQSLQGKLAVAAANKMLLVG